MSKHLKDLRMYKCILVLRSAVRATFAGYASESCDFFQVIIHNHAKGMKSVI